MLTQEQTETIKKRLIEQIESTFPEDRKQFAVSQLEAMSSDELEKFLIKNNLLRADNSSQENCVFCAIISGAIKSYKIAENKKAIAVLEINPLTKGHVIIIPRGHESQEKQPKEISEMAKKTAILLKSRLKAKEIKKEKSNILGHDIINLIPIYENQELSSERKPATQEELSELQEILTKPVFKKVRKRAEKKAGKEKQNIKNMIKEFEEKIWLPKRIP